jgi:homoserine dehydrogenase
MSGAGATIVSTDPDGCPREAASPAAAAEGPLLVLKFGGTAVGTPARIRSAAKRVRRHVRAGARVAVVVSATGDTTDRIVRWLKAVAPEGASEAAREFHRGLATGEDLSAAQARGSRFVTANKALIGEVGADLVALAREGFGSIDFEAAVGGGIPVIRVLRDALSEGPVHGIRAILNGTTNYILTHLERGVPFRLALQEAQRNGFAEADPTRDLDGTDAADKIRILAWLAYGVPPRALAVRSRGILPDPDRLARDAAAAGGSLRLLAECMAEDGAVSASVEPVIVSAGSEFGRTTEEQNHVSIDLGWSRPVALSGPGAGGIPTAAALLGDILRSCGPLPRVAPSGTRPAPENRSHSWLVSAQRGGELRGRLDALGCGGKPLPADSAHERVLVSRCGWTRLEACLRPLEAEGLRPLATRVDLPPEIGDGVSSQAVLANIC